MTSPAPVILVRDGLAVPLMAALTAMLWYSAYSVSQRVNMHEAMTDPVPFSIFVFGLAVMVGLGPLAFVLTHLRIELDGHTLTVRRPARRTVTCSVSDLRQVVFFLSGSAVGVGMELEVTAAAVARAAIERLVTLLGTSQIFPRGTVGHNDLSLQRVGACFNGVIVNMN